MNSRVIYFLFFLLVFSACRNKIYNEDDAIRSLKVLNSDLNNLFSRGGEMQEIKAMNFLWEQESAPLPWPKEEYTLGKPYQTFCFDSVTGNYFWEPDSLKFMKVADGGSINIFFSTPEIDSARFLITDFENKEISSHPEFPVKMNAQLFLNGEERLLINHMAEVEDELIKNMITSVKGDKFTVEATLNRTRNISAGHVNSYFHLEYLNRKIIQVDFNSTIGYSNMGFYFEKLNFDAVLFSHRIIGRIDYDKINPTDEDYAQSFNSNSKIEIFEMPGKKKVGDIVLGTRKDTNLLDYHVKFAGGSMILIEEDLPILDKLLNLKL